MERETPPSVKRQREDLLARAVERANEISRKRKADQEVQQRTERSPEDPKDGSSLKVVDAALAELATPSVVDLQLPADASDTTPGKAA